MSLECPECEHDLRSGHAEGCSRRPRQCAFWREESIYPTVMAQCSRKAIPESKYCKQHAKMQGEFKDKGNKK